MKTKLFGMACAAALTCVYSLSVHAAPTLVEVAKLLADDGAADDFFGQSVALSGDTAVIGARLDDDLGTDSGSAYVFVRSGSSWTQQAKLLADDGAAGDSFGYSVAVSGDTVVIGTPYDDDRGSRSGSAYVFVRSGSSWTQQAKLLADHGHAGDWFGRSVAVFGDTAVIGASRDDDLGSFAGAAYVFVRSGNSWTQQAKLLADDGRQYHKFGYSVAVSGDTAVIGAVQDHYIVIGPSKIYSFKGAAYVFVRSGNSWTQQTKLLADDGALGDYFGISVALSGDTAVIGARLDDDRGTNSGSAYVFVRSGTSWTQQAKLLADDGAWYDDFGRSVAVSGDTAVIGADLHDDLGTNSGSAYVFVRSGNSWTQPAELLADDGGTGDDFGYSVAVSGDTAVIGAWDDDDLGTKAGAAYVFSVPGFDSDVFDTFHYFPLQSGNEWTYLKNGSTNVTEIVLGGTVVVNGVATKALQDSDGLVSYLTNDSNGVRFHRDFEPGVDFGDGVPRDSTYTYSPPIQLLAAQTQIGDEFSGNGAVTAEIAGLGSFALDYALTSKIEKLENVSVPLDTFLALKVKYTLNLTGSIIGEPINETFINTSWLTKYVGQVKMTEEAVGEGTDTLELVAVLVDSDGDGVNVTDDNCPIISNPGQEDLDNDGIGDACDPDIDGDGIGNNADTDDDGDTMPDDFELANGFDPNNPDDANEDADSDGLTNLEEFIAGTLPHNPDTDGDTVLDGVDAFPNDPTESVDTDGNGIGNNADPDDDGDGMPDDFESANGLDPLDAADAAGDADGDGFTNLEEFRRGTDPQNPTDFPIVPVAIFIILGEEEQ